MITLFFIYQILSVGSCFLNKTFFIYNAWPIETCDLTNPWNQSAFSGLEFPLYQEIVRNTGWNTSEILFHCIASDAEIYEAYGTSDAPSPYDYYLGTFDGWIITPITVPWHFTQPYHEVKFGAVVSYDKPLLVYFNNIDIDVIILLLIIPIVIGVIFNFLNEKFSRFYQISDYFGLIFFQPEIVFKRNISSKILTLLIQMISLIVINVFIYSLQISFENVKSHGGKSIENGLADQFIYAYDASIYRIMANTLMKPLSVGAPWILIDEWKNFIKQHKGKLYFMEHFFANVLSLQDCSLTYIGDFYSVYITSYSGRETRKELIQLSASVVETIEFDYKFTPTYNMSEIIPRDQWNCKQKTSKIFQYSILDFYHLWIMYLICTIFAIILKIISLCYYNKTHFRLGITENRFKELRKEIIISHIQSFMWLKHYQLNFVYSVSILKLRSIRQHLIGKKSKIIDKIPLKRRKVIVYYLNNSRKKIYIKLIFYAIIFLSKLMKKRGKNNVPLSQLMEIERNKLISKKNYRKKLNRLILKQAEIKISKLIKLSLKECLFDALKLLKICEIDYYSKLAKCVSGKHFEKKIIIKLKKTKQKLNPTPLHESIHSHMKMLFLNKIIERFLIIPKLRSHLTSKKILKHQDQLRLLMLQKKDLSKAFTDVLGALKYILKTKKQNRKKLVIGKTMNNILSANYMPNNLKLQQKHFFFIDSSAQKS